MRYLTLISSSLLFCSLLLISCSTSSSFKKYSTLSNQGILPLSTTNAYVGANLFIAEESRKSSYLRNFLKARGGPTAIELTEDSNRPPHMVMFYPKDKEVFAAEYVEKKLAPDQYFREWIIRGPYQIERKDYRELTRLEGSFAGEPLFVINGKEQRFKFNSSSSDEVKEILVPVIPTPKPTRKPAPIQRAPKSDGESKVTSDGGENPQDFKPMNLDQQAIQMAKGYAERAENGDVIHVVHSSSETLAIIAKWYTGAPSNAAVIAETNHSNLDAPLLEGQRIVVPIKLLKTAKVMPLGFK